MSASDFVQHASKHRCASQNPIFTCHFRHDGCQKGHLKFCMRLDITRAYLLVKRAYYLFACVSWNQAKCVTHNPVGIDGKLCPIFYFFEKNPIDFLVNLKNLFRKIRLFAEKQ